MLRASWDDLYNLKNVENTHEGIFLLVKLQASVVQMVPNRAERLIWIILPVKGFIIWLVEFFFFYLIKYNFVVANISSSE